MRVRVHLNLHNGKFNVSTYTKGKGWRLHKYSSFLVLDDVSFRVSHVGNARVRREGKKNVHAFLFGNLFEGVVTLKPLDSYRQISYNPYENTGFVIKGTEEEPTYVMRVVCKDGRVYVCGPLQTTGKT